ncbi:MAG: hypothetical protein HY017_25880 [Betaproteobacteria bacterium]|nr:hypothetical protein [Betaproteobacteria bacterium]
MLSRRSVLIGALAAASGAWGQAAPLTLSCGKPTERQTAGPYFKPMADALVDFWHADEFGEYDNNGIRYRGHQYTDAQGRWRLETVFPAEYPGRARRLHVDMACYCQ